MFWLKPIKNLCNKKTSSWICFSDKNSTIGNEICSVGSYMILDYEWTKTQLNNKSTTNVAQFSRSEVYK